MEGVIGVRKDTSSPLEHGTRKVGDDEQHLHFVGVIARWSQFENR